MGFGNGVICTLLRSAWLTAWAAMRRRWIGDQGQAPKEAPRESIISWCTTYDDLLSTSERFPQPIPLSEMVDFFGRHMA